MMLLVGSAMAAAVAIINLLDVASISGGEFMTAVINSMAAGASGRRAVAHGWLTRFAPGGNAPSPANITYLLENAINLRLKSNLSLSIWFTNRTYSS